MVEVAWAAIKKKDSYFKDKYYRLKARRGAKRAIVAVAHRILLGIYHVINDGVEFRDLGAGYLTEQKKNAKDFILTKTGSINGIQTCCTTHINVLHNKKTDTAIHYRGRFKTEATSASTNMTDQLGTTNCWLF